MGEPAPWRWHNVVMSGFTTLMARDGHEFNAWLAAPTGAARGAVVVAQEIFGVNRHIRRVTDDFAAQGYVAIAPCLFDRVRRGIELGYSEDEVQLGRGTRLQIPLEQTMRDLSASLNVVKHAGRVAVVGYCWGGTLAYVAACELPVACAVSYYGGQIKDHLAKSPRRQVMYHFGEQDPHIPVGDIERIRAADADGIFHLYPADHGFNCEERATYDAASAQLARERTLEFLARKLNPPPRPSENE
jgi:carboxymethylenebutenolidase